MSTGHDDDDPDEKGVEFPYVFLNTDELVTRPESRIKERTAEELTKFLDYDQKIDGVPKLKHSIGQTYIALLKSISESDISGLGKLCEGNMIQAFSEGLGSLHRHTDEIQLLNIDGTETTWNDVVDNQMQMQVLDWGPCFGAEIDRRTNLENRLKRVNVGKQRTDAFVSSNSKWGETMLKMNLRVVVKITTDIKLNLINNEG